MTSQENGATAQFRCDRKSVAPDGSVWQCVLNRGHIGEHRWPIKASQQFVPKFVQIAVAEVAREPTVFGLAEDGSVWMFAGAKGSLGWVLLPTTVIDPTLPGTA